MKFAKMRGLAFLCKIRQALPDRPSDTYFSRHDAFFPARTRILAVDDAFFAEVAAEQDANETAADADSEAAQVC